jgi:hypothetical protein
MSAAAILFALSPLIGVLIAWPVAKWNERGRGCSALLQCDEPEPRGDVADGCRWLHGPAEDRNYCGAPTVRFGLSWCHHHAARVWNPATPAQVAKFAKFVTWRAA